MMKHQCKVCGKSFPCGRSLGGHMRSHLPLNLSSERGERPETSKNRGNSKSKKKTMWLSAFEMKEERKSMVNEISLSGISKTETEEAAFCLIMLSRDTRSWTGIRKIRKKALLYGFDHQLKKESKIQSFKLKRKNLETSNVDKRSTELPDSISRGKKGMNNGSYECSQCNKSFDSYHALGGHIAGRKRGSKTCNSAPDNEFCDDNNNNTNNNSSETCEIKEEFMMYDFLNLNERSWIQSNSGEDSLFGLISN